MKRFVPLLLLCAHSLSGCHEPVVPDSETVSGSNGNNVHIPSAAEIMANKEAYYATLLPQLQARDPAADARTAIAKGERYFLCNAGRNAAPAGIAPEVFTQVGDICPVKCLDGVTDAIYGDNHRRDLSLALDYSAKWNQVMLAACR